MRTDEEKAPMKDLEDIVMEKGDWLDYRTPKIRRTALLMDKASSSLKNICHEVRKLEILGLEKAWLVKYDDIEKSLPLEKINGKWFYGEWTKSGEFNLIFGVTRVSDGNLAPYCKRVFDRAWKSDTSLWSVSTVDGKGLVSNHPFRMIWHKNVVGWKEGAEMLSNFSKNERGARLSRGSSILTLNVLLDKLKSDDGHKWMNLILALNNIQRISAGFSEKSVRDALSDLSREDWLDRKQGVREILMNYVESGESEVLEELARLDDGACRALDEGEDLLRETAQGRVGIQRRV